MKPEHERALQELRAELVAVVRNNCALRSREDLYRHAVWRIRTAIRSVRALDAALAEIERAKDDALHLFYVAEGYEDPEVRERVQGYARERAGRGTGR